MRFCTTGRPRNGESLKQVEIMDSQSQAFDSEGKTLHKNTTRKPCTCISFYLPKQKQKHLRLLFNKKWAQETPKSIITIINNKGPSWLDCPEPESPFTVQPWALRQAARWNQTPPRPGKRRHEVAMETAAAAGTDPRGGGRGRAEAVGYARA